MKVIITGLIFAFFLANFSFGQQVAKPLKCNIPGGGVLLGGSFTITPALACLDFQTTAASPFVSNALTTAGDGNFTNLGYIFDFKDGDDFNVFPNPIQTSKTFTRSGTYWILQGMNFNGDAYIACQSFEIIQTETPDVQVNYCGTNEMNLLFRKSIINDKHRSYKIIWGDGIEEEIPNLTSADFPFTKTHTYRSMPLSQPKIIGFYEKGCSSIFNFTPEASKQPKISELEGLAGGVESKITMIAGTDGKEYSIEQKISGGNWVATDKKIIRTTGEASKTATITGLNPANQYCFRLKISDGCGGTILSNEVCSITPSSVLLSTTEVLISWNSPTTAPVRYSVGYSESPGEINAKNKNPNPIDATSISISPLDCSKKYNFQIVAKIDAESVQIKSPVVLINPANAPKITPSVLGLATVLNDEMVRFTAVKLDDKTTEKYVFYRSEADMPNFILGNVVGNVYEDTNAKPSQQQYCYKVAYQDLCQNISNLSADFCSIFLSTKEKNTLYWTAPASTSSVIQSISYFLDAIDENGNVINETAVTDMQKNVTDLITQLSNFNQNGEAKFRVRGNLLALFKDSLTNFTVLSNTYTFRANAKIYLPTAFSPNNDKNNDDFKAQGKYTQRFNLEIYDHWGSLIFETKNINEGWNGTATDKITPAPAGSYVFRVYGLGLSGEKFEKVGTVILIR